MSANKKKSKNKKKNSINLTSTGLSNETQSNEGSNETQSNEGSNETQSNEEIEVPKIEITLAEELVIEEDTSTNVNNTELTFKQVMDNIGDALEKEANNIITNNEISQEKIIHKVVEELKEEIVEVVDHVKKQTTQLKIALLKRRK